MIKGSGTEYAEDSRGGRPIRGRYGLQVLFPAHVDGNDLLLPITEFTVADYDFTAVIGNLQKARRSWSRISRIMGQEGIDAHTLGHLYQSIVNEILLFGLETGVMTPHIGRVLGVFRHHVE